MKQDVKSFETQNLIIESAFQLFYKKGYESTSIPEIMKATSLSKGAFYHHFKDKNEIGLRVVVEFVRKRIHDGMIAPLKIRTDESVIDLLIKVFTKRIRSFSNEEKDLGCPANNLINELGCQQGAIRVELRDLINDWRKELIALLNEGKRRGEVRNDLNVSATVTFLIGAFEGVRGLRKIYDDDKILEEYLIELTRYIRGLE